MAPSFSYFEGYESPLSNLRFSYFLIDDQEYNSVEQYFQFHKAKFFNDAVAMERLKNKDINPMSCNRIGDQIDTSEAPPKWLDHALDIMKKALHAKFTQNEGVRKYLFKTADSTLVHCSTVDLFWGSGYKRYDPRNRYPLEWLGKNKLGALVTEVRDELMKAPEYKDLVKIVEKEKEKAKKERERVLAAHATKRKSQTEGEPPAKKRMIRTSP